MESPLRQAEHWLLESGIQSGGGGFHGWYNLESQSYPFLYSEATGYGISTLLAMGETSRAVLAANWLIKHAYLKNQAFRSHFYYKEGRFQLSMYTFDNAVCLKALLDLYRVTKQHKFLIHAWWIGDWLLKTQLPNGKFQAVFPPSSNRGWSVQSGCYHAKNAVALLNLAEIVDEPQYERAARHICEWTLRRQKKDGSFPTKQLHPHCYAAEGLLYTGRKLDDPRFVNAASKAVSYLITQPVSRPDVLAQKISLMLEFNFNIDDEIQELLKHQCQSNDPRGDGGFMFNRKHVNSWTTIFAVEAIRRWLRL